MSWYGNVGNAIKKGAKDGGHAVGNALNNPLVKVAGGAVLAATGVGIPLAAAIGAGAGVLGGTLRSGGGLKGALTEGGQGLLIGAGSGVAGNLIGRAGGLGHIASVAGKGVGSAGGLIAGGLRRGTAAVGGVVSDFGSGAQVGWTGAGSHAGSDGFAPLQLDATGHHYFPKVDTSGSADAPSINAKPETTNTGGDNGGNDSNGGGGADFNGGSSPAQASMASGPRGAGGNSTMLLIAAGFAVAFFAFKKH